MASKVLIIGACGQIGSELTFALRERYGNLNVIASDISYSNAEVVHGGLFEIVDATDYASVKICIEKHGIDTVYLMAALLSATGEKYPMKAWNLNMDSLFHVLNLAKEGFIKQVFWPSSIAVFGPTTPKNHTPQHTVTAPTTVYGITKQVGELWCAYYHKNYGVDVRSLRYPGIISWKTMPGGGTTDYAVDIFYKALEEGAYTSFLTADTALPMMYMDDAIAATLTLMEAPAAAISIRTSYNLSAMSFTPKVLAAEIQKHLPDFRISYAPDYRQAIADSWPSSIDDSAAQQDWGWKPKYDLTALTATMLEKLQEKLGVV